MNNVPARFIKNDIMAEKDKEKPELPQAETTTTNLPPAEMTPLAISLNNDNYQFPSLAPAPLSTPKPSSYNEYLEQQLEQKRTEEYIYRAIINATRDAVIMVDNEGIINLWNFAAEKLFGWTKEEAMGKNVHDFIAPEEFHNNVVKGPVIGKTLELEAVHKDGHEFAIELSLSPVKFGENVGAVGIVRDITERKKTDVALKDSEDKFRNLAEGIKDVVYSLDPEGTFTYIGPQVSAYGLDQEKMIGKNFLEFVHPDDREHIINDYTRMMKTGEEFTSEFRFLDDSGNSHWFEEMGQAQWDEKGSFIKSTGVIRDITVRKQTESALRESESKYKLLVENLNEGVWQIDKDGFTTFVNSKMAEMLGYDVSEMLGKPLFDFMDENGKKIAAENIRKRQSGIKEQHDFEFQRKSGEKIYALLETSPITDENGNYLGALAGVQDITERKKAEILLRESERLGVIGEIAAGVAHDMNNALQGIIVGIELALYDHNLPPETRDDLAVAKQSALDAAERIRQIQRFAGKTHESSKHKIVDIKHVLDDAVLQTKSLWKNDAQKNGLKIDIDLTCQYDMTVMGNSGELRSILFNLIKNSIEAMPEGGTITIDARKENNEIILTVTDTGTGMDEEIRLRVFQPFFSTKGFEQGRGLGMSGVYTLVKEHKGSIEVKNTAPGKGTTIEIRLPHAEYILKPPIESGVEYQGSLKILWVDDEPVIRNFGEKIIQKFGHQIDLAESGRQAMELLEKNQYDLMITDIGMPGMSGYQLIEKIKGKYPQMKIAIVTGWGDKITLEEKIKHDVGYIVGKPVQIDQLKNLIREVAQMK